MVRIPAFRASQDIGDLGPNDQRFELLELVPLSTDITLRNSYLARGKLVRHGFYMLLPMNI